ncbi:hypothetical protein Tco_0875954 [Tanacetum coccineum]|uniref:Reverse transcriptase domain-containing protein n=1 Tax=Tanacetum coccineum TaxID=301880 RepID=A0ABQ5BTZ5_9ASTR
MRRSRKERIEPLRVRALVMTIGLDLPKRILEAQIEAQKPENLVNEDVGGMIQRGYTQGRVETSCRCGHMLTLAGVGYLLWRLRSGDYALKSHKSKIVAKTGYLPQYLAIVMEVSLQFLGDLFQKAVGRILA